MAPKRAYGPATRRSSRLASQTNSRASSVSQETTSGLFLSQPPVTSPPCPEYQSLTLANPATALKRESRAGKPVSEPMPELVPERAPEPVPAPLPQPVLEPKPEPVDDFDVAIAHRRIVREGDRHYIHRLTDVEKGAVIQVLADREVDLLDRIRELEAENADLSLERDEALQKCEEKRRLRDMFFRERLQHAEQQREEAVRAAAATPVTISVVDERNVDEENAEEENEAESSDFPSETIIDTPLPESVLEGTPLAPVEVVNAGTMALTRADDTGTPARRTSLLRRVFDTIASPFARKPAVVDTRTDSSPLGELPSSRKRPAPDDAPDVSPSPLVPPPEKPRHQPAGPPSTPGPSSRNPIFPTSLETITEHTEPSVRAPDSTPTRPTMETRTPHAFRSIASVRNAQRQKAVNTPVHPWTQPPRPRDPNADRRLEKLRRYEHVRQELEALKRDDDLRDVVGHRVKRVKVDDLAQIPHNRPGDAKGTFRVPDIDSDDEMEVDDSSEMRTNVFALVDEEKKAADEAKRAADAAKRAADAAKKATAEAKEAAARVEPPSPQSQSDDSVHTIYDWPDVGNSHAAKIVDQEDQEVYNWPDIGIYKPGLTSSGTNSPNAADTFSKAFDHWQETGEIIPAYTAS